MRRAQQLRCLHRRCFLQRSSVAMWTSSDHYLAPPPPPGGRGRLWSALLLLAVGVVTLAVLAVVAIAVVLGGYQKPREPIQQEPPRRVAPSATWGEEVPDEQLPSRLLTQQRLRTTVRHFPLAEITTSSTTSTSTTTTSTSTTTSAPKLPTFKVKGSVDFDQKQQQQQTQRRDWPTETHEHEWRPGEVAVVQDPAELLSTTAATHLPARSYIGIKGDLVLPTLFPPTSTDTEKPRLVGTTDIPALDLGMIDSISKSFTNMAIRVRPQHPMQPPIHKLSPTPESAVQETTVSNVITPEPIPLESMVEIVPDSAIPSNTEYLNHAFPNNSHHNQPIILGIATPAENINEPDITIQGIPSSEISYEPHLGIAIPEEISDFHNPIVAADSKAEPNSPTLDTKPPMQEIDFAHDKVDETSDTESNHSDISSPDSEREEKSITEIVPTVSDTTTTYLESNETEVTLLESTFESVTEFLEETTTPIPEELQEDSTSVVTPSPTLQQMTSRAAVERTAKQDHIPADGSQFVQREPKGTLVQAFPSSEFNSSPAFLRNRKRNMTTTTTTQKPPKIVENCTCAARLEAQGLSRKICDGVLDCWDYSDEENCEWCAPGRHVCAHSRACVPKSKLCDGRRDCPFGDDERNCVAVAPDRKQADSVDYHDNGLLMVQKTGVWGTLCVEKLEGSAWRLGDVARAVCRALTYGDFELAEQVQVSRSAGPYYELNLQIGRNGGSTSGGSPRLAVDSTDCPSRAAVRLGCRDLQCGVRPLAGNQWASPPPRRRGSRIVGGGNAGPGAWPWQAALYKEGQFQCGGSLIAAQWLISASHCFAHNLDAYWVARLGALRRGTDLASPFEQLRRVVRIVQHPGYLDHGFVNDLALLRLEKPVLFSDFIRPVCLPPPDADEPGPEGQMCTVVGWGQLSEVGRIFPDTLQEVQLPLISTEECRKRTLFLPLYRVTEDMFCAGFERGGRDACLGDSGGPLMCQRSDARWELTGITSNGYGCARANRPGVYTKVANYVRWIAQVMDSDRAINTTAPACPKGQQRCALGHCSAPPDGSCGKLYCPAA